ncbi:MAG: alpha/beta hydrolase [Candidatus Hodarchaeota archaeon]
MVEVEKIFIENNEIKLEAEYFQSVENTVHPIVLICHPHPQFGGDMYNNVVSAIFNLLTQNQISALRFNFRGVGESNGSHTSGSGELTDVKTCIDYLMNQKDFKKIFICGYSYGAAIGCSAVNYSEKVIGYCAISFPWDFMGIKYKELAQTEKPKLFIQGDRDDIANYSRFKSHYEFYQNPKKYVIIEGADHFYWGYEDQLANVMLDFYKSIT